MQASALPSQFSHLLELPNELRMRIYKFTFAGSELIVHARSHPGDNKQWQGMRDWEHAWYRFHETRRREADLEASRYPMALTKTSTFLRWETQPILAAATYLLAVGVDARVMLSMIPTHITQYVKSFITLRQTFRCYTCHGVMDDLEPLVRLNLPRLEQLSTHVQYENPNVLILDHIVKAEFRSLECLLNLKQRYFSQRQLCALIKSVRHPFMGIGVMAKHASFSMKHVIHFSYARRGLNSNVKVPACLVSTDLYQTIICI